MRNKAVAIAVAAVAAVGGSIGAVSAWGGSNEVVLGASIPLTGALAPFGPQIKDGYTYAVNAINAAGGVNVGGQKRKIKLVVLDNKSDPNLAASQTRTLVNSDGAVALLGSVTPPLTIPQSTTADALRVPYVTGLTPVHAWSTGAKKGYTYAYDLFIDDNVLGTLPFSVMKAAKVGKKISLFYDNEADGIVDSQLWTKLAPKYGFTVVNKTQFPVGTTDFGAFISKAKDSGADILIGTMTPPDGFALWKQIKAAGWQPKVAWCFKCANNGAWGAALGAIAEGTSTLTYWAPELKRPGTAAIVKKFGKKYPDVHDLAGVVSSDTVVRIVVDAITKAGTTDAAKVNAAIAQTNKAYTYADVKFNKAHYSVVPAQATQWQKGSSPVIYPTKYASGKLQAPVKGL